MKLPHVLPPAVVLTSLLLGACDPIQIDIIFENHNTYVQDTQDGGPPPDKVGGDAGLPPIMTDAGTSDGGLSDGGLSDAGTSDGGLSDGGTSDGGLSDAGTSDGGLSDGGLPDASCVEGRRSREVAVDVESAAFAFDSQGLGYLAMTDEGKVFVGGMGQGHALIQAGELQGYVRGFAIDADGGRHLVVDYSGSTVYAYSGSVSWQSTAIARGVPVALALDPSGFAHVLLDMETGSERRLAHATNRSGQWVITDLGIQSRSGGADLAVDAWGHAHIAWHTNAESGIYYATNASGTWMQERVADISGNEPVLAIDSSMRPHLLYSYGGSYVQHAVKEDGGWRIEEVGPSAGIALDLVADSRGNLHAVLDRFENPKLVRAFLPAGRQSWSYTPIIALDGKEGVTHPWEYALGLGPLGEVRIGYWYALVGNGTEVVGSSVRYAEPCP
ncbi:hypothetical protein JRI60_39940 [Archangium violaceum]|uniref:hypothetical protein n=1 Tax=Archangium violaceum TaxID=83451 RepID=UPI00195238BC|nr:hypothetical protein [Archangium violaceum]QRN95194.1 hypothetical protein JRI60_39940 [Archangium violaceum]